MPRIQGALAVYPLSSPTGDKICFCLSFVGVRLCPSRERSERVANKNRIESSH